MQQGMFLNKGKLLKEVFLWGDVGVILFLLSSIILTEGLVYKPSYNEMISMVVFISIMLVAYKIVGKNLQQRYKWTHISLLSLLGGVSVYYGMKAFLRCLNLPTTNAILSYLIILLMTSPCLWMRKKKTCYLVLSGICLGLCYITSLIKGNLYYTSLPQAVKNVFLDLSNTFTSGRLLGLILILIIFVLSGILYIKEDRVAVDGTKYKVLMVIVLSCVVCFQGLILSDGTNAEVGSVFSAIKVYNRNIRLSTYRYVEDEELPLISFEGDFTGITNKNEKIVSITYKSKEQSFSVYSKIKWQGTSSLTYPKKNYTIKLFSDSDVKEKYMVDFEGWGEENKFCLKANFIDFTQARNVVSAKIGGEISEDIWPVEAPNNGCIDGFPVRVVINGLYQGLYTLNIPKDGWMFGMDEDNINHMVWCAEENNNGINVSDEILACEFRNLAKGNELDWSLEFPSEQNEYNLAALNRVISFVKDTSDQEFVDEFENYFNKEAVLNYYIFQYFSAGIDGLAKNLLMVTYDGLVWYPSLYDLDSTWGLWWDGSKLMDYDIECPGEYQETNSLLWERIEKLFSEDLYLQYIKLRENELSQKNVINEFTKFIRQIDPEIYEEEKMIWPEIPSIGLTSMEQLEEFISKRAMYVDMMFEEKRVMLD